MENNSHKHTSHTSNDREEKEMSSQIVKNCKDTKIQKRIYDICIKLFVYDSFLSMNNAKKKNCVLMSNEFLLQNKMKCENCLLVEKNEN